MTAMIDNGLTLPAAEAESIPRVYLYPGQIVTSTSPLMVSTILGSCISVCMWDASALVGGINHYLLPTGAVPGQDDLRYGNTAIERLISEVLALGVRKQRIVAKIVGGASIFTPRGNGGRSIGEQNVAVAEQVLAKHGIDIIGKQTGGTSGRKLLFHTGIGAVLTKEIGS
jgi:chemotaxis protein CheD